MNYLSFIKDKNRNQNKEFILFGIVLFLFSFLLGLLCFFQNTKTKDNLYNSLPLSYTVTNDTILANDRSEINIVDYKSESNNDVYCVDLLNLYVDTINEFETLDNDTSFYNYTLDIHDELFGFCDTKFFDQYNMPLVEYDDSLSDLNGIILPNSKSNSYSIGDKYKFYWTDEEFAVIGFYDDSIQYNFNNKDINFLNKKVAFTTNANVLNILKNDNTLIKYSKLNNIEFVFNDYTKYESFRNEFNKTFLLNEVTLTLNTTLDRNIITRMNDTFLLVKVILIVILVVTILIMYSFINLLFNQNKKELYILYSFGLSSRQIVILYQAYIFIESILFIILGLIIAYVTSSIIDYNISLKQNELISYLSRISGKRVDDVSTSIISIKDIFKILLSFIYSILIVAISSLIATIKNLKSSFGVEMR